MVSRTETLKKIFKTTLSGAAFACAIAAASPGNAAQYFLNTATMDTSRTATIVGPGMNAHVYAGPIKFKTYNGTAAIGQSFDIVGFCVDIFHSISLGTINLKYDDSYQLTTDSKYLTNTPFAPGATVLTNAQKLQVGRLVNYGTLVFNQAPASSDKSSQLAALQGAIWQVINPTYTVASSNSTVNTQIGQFAGAGYNDLLTGYGPVTSGITFITQTGKYGTKSARQSFAFASPNGGAAIPEPSTWALMIGGFAMAGAALRRSRPALARARAA